jgi:hypothetical protein
MNQPEVFVLNCPRCGAALPRLGEVTECEYCHTRVIIHDSQVPARSAVPGPENVTVQSFSFIDPCSRMEAFRTGMPTGWQFDGGVTWQNVSSYPAIIAYRVFNPGGIEAFEVLRNYNMTWTNNPIMRTQIPVGSNYLGSEMRPPVNAGQALQEIYLPRHRAIPGLQVVSVEQAVDMIEKFRRMPNLQSPNVSVDAARMRIAYRLDNVDLTEQFTSAIFYVQSPMLLSWTLCATAAFRARTEEFERWQPVSDKIAEMCAINPQWDNYVAQTAVNMSQQQINQMNAMVQASMRNAQQQSQMVDGFLEVGRQQSQAWDRTIQNHVDNIRGVDQWQDPFTGNNVALPNAYPNAWCNALGEYIVSDDPNFNPNPGSSVSWTQMAHPSRPE